MCVVLYMVQVADSACEDVDQLCGADDELGGCKHGTRLPDLPGQGRSTHPLFTPDPGPVSREPS